MTTTIPTLRQRIDGLLDGRASEPSPDNEMSRRLAALLDDPPLVRGVRAGGQWPTLAEVDAVRGELAKLPRNVADELDGWRLEVVAGDTARVHPEAIPGKPNCGFCWTSKKLIVVAGRADILTTLHEAGHCIDACNRVSGLRAWRQALGGDDQRGEYFAESFARFWHGQATRARLPPRVLAFFHALQRCFS